MKLNAFQLEKLQNALTYFTIASGTANSINVTTALTTRLNTSGDGGVSVPLQDSSLTSVGVVVIGGNICKIFQSNGEAIYDANANRVYARITSAAGIYTLSYFVLLAGVESAYSFVSSVNLLVGIPYRFDFGRFPSDAHTNIQIEDILQPSNTTSAKWFSEKLTVTALNTVSNLTKSPTTPTNIFLIVNGKSENSFAGSSATFSASGKSITIAPINMGYNIQTNFDVIAFYETLE